MSDSFRATYKGEDILIQKESWWFYLWASIVLVIIIYLIYIEYIQHDCIDGKECQEQDPLPEDGLDDAEYLDRIQNMYNTTSYASIWRLALIVGLSISFAVSFFLKARWPTLAEYIVVAFFITFATFFSFSWLWTHFYEPNNLRLNACIHELKDRLKENKDRVIIKTE